MSLFSRSGPERARAVVRLSCASLHLQMQGLVPGVDNFRHDVYLSPKFCKYTAEYLFRLFFKHSAAGELVEHKLDPPSPKERAEFKRLLQEVLLSALSRAKAARNPDIDLLANVATFKYLGWEMQQQYARVVQEGRNKLKIYEGPRHERNPRAFRIKEIFSDFQASKKNVLRRVSSEVLSLVNEIQADLVRRTRESFFGSDTAQWFAYFSNPLVFTETGRDDYIHLAKYVMFGNYNRDPDVYDKVETWLKGFLKHLDGDSPEGQELERMQQQYLGLQSEAELLRQHLSPDKARGLARLFGSRNDPVASAPSPGLAEKLRTMEEAMAQMAENLRLLAETYDVRLSEQLNVPENADALLGTARTEQAIADATLRKAPREEIAALQEQLEAQRAIAEEIYASAQQSGLLLFIAAAYETARLYQDYCPPINPQQLKHALLDPAERRKVSDLIAHYKLKAGTTAIDEAAARLRTLSQRDLRAMLVRFVQDFFRHHHDARLLSVLQGLQDKVNLAFDEKTRQLSRINNTLYEFLLPEEQRPKDEQVSGHVILKADVRDSTALTAELLARGLNPASHFSLNFYDPLNKLLPKYDAEKVFIEGDAVILAIFDKQGAALGGYPVARACGLAREMMEVVNAYNARADRSGLPRLEIGIGICWQNNAPMYLLDGETRIMISSAINLADRLSGCSKLARRALAQRESLFNVFVFQTITEEAAAGAMEEFLVRYNTGVSLSEEAFAKLQEEISLTPVDLEIPVLQGPESVRLHCGSFPLAGEIFQRLVVRESPIPFVSAQDFSTLQHTERRYYEVCTNRLVYEYTDSRFAAAMKNEQ